MGRRHGSAAQHARRAAGDVNSPGRRGAGARTSTWNRTWHMNPVGEMRGCDSLLVGAATHYLAMLCLLETNSYTARTKLL